MNKLNEQAALRNLEEAKEMDALRHADELGIDPTILLNIFERSTEVQDPDAFLGLINNNVQAVMHQEIMVCGVGGMSPNGNYAHKILEHGYPEQYFHDLATPDGRVDSPLMRHWRDTLAPVIFQSGRDDAEYPQDWVTIFNKYDLRNTAAHGVLDVQRNFATYFIFSRIPGEIGEREIYLLKMLTPHLHLALVRALVTVQEFTWLSGTPHEALSERQKEILHWIDEGKTNWEIAQILGMTEKNVKYHIEQIFLKLKVTNRNKAVAKAMLLGILR
ncbi:MAG: helix-turn-helix transcriptional regulator [Burkholderiaceae bacterium]